jgi:hypothetical protein
MAFLSPWWLLGLLAVAGVAAWALWRPGRQVITVGSLELWHRALASLSRSQRLPSRRRSASWWCLLIGAALAVLALAEPVFIRHQPQRRIAVGVIPSYELASLDGDAQTWAGPAGRLLDRLDPGDRVQVLRPALLGGATDWLSVDEARYELRRMVTLPVLADEISLPPPDPAAQHTVVFRYQATTPQPAPRRSVVRVIGDLASHIPTALDARGLTDGTVEVFVGLPDDAAPLEVGGWPEGRVEDVGPTVEPLRVEQAGPDGRVAVMPAADVFSISLGSVVSYLTRLPKREIAVAVTGQPTAAVERYIQADAFLRHVPSEADADVVIACRTAPPPGKPALVIDSPKPPPGWRTSVPVTNILLGEVDIRSNDALFRGVHLPGMAVRTARPWAAGRGLELQGRIKAAPAVLTVDDRALLVKQPGDQERARQMWLAFEVSETNTNLDQAEGFVVLLANAVRWLADAAEPSGEYGFLTPQQASGLAAMPLGGPAESTVLPWPGLYRNSAGSFTAVAVLPPPLTAPPENPFDAVDTIDLPTPMLREADAALWPLLAGCAGALWIIGWGVRIK